MLVGVRFGMKPRYDGKMRKCWKSQKIIKNRYFVEARQTFASIGRELNLSKDRVRQLENCALQTLKELTEPGLIDGQIIIK